MDIKLNIAFRNLKVYNDSERREQHIFDRMQLRGIGKEQMKEAIQKGAKIRREDGSLIAEFRWFKVIYREFVVDNLRKVYPITVIEV